MKEAIEDCDVLNPAGIEVKVCSDNNLEGEKTLRIFPIDQVKGMEFEAVFFYDIDDIESSSLINKYLYVGLSRASILHSRQLPNELNIICLFLRE